MRTWSIPWWERRTYKSKRRWEYNSCWTGPAQVVMYHLSDAICVNCQLSQAPESSPASEALQLIFADSGLDGKSIMLDLSKLLNEDPNLANQVRENNFWPKDGSTFQQNTFLLTFPTSWRAATTRPGSRYLLQRLPPCRYQSAHRCEIKIKERRSDVLAY